MLSMDYRAITRWTQPFKGIVMEESKFTIFKTKDYGSYEYLVVGYGCTPSFIQVTNKKDTFNSIMIPLKILNELLTPTHKH